MEHGEKHSLLQHESRDHHVWTALPELRRSCCYREFAEKEPHYSPPSLLLTVPRGSARRPSKFLDHEAIEKLGEQRNSGAGGEH